MYDYTTGWQAPLIRARQSLIRCGIVFYALVCRIAVIIEIGRVGPNWDLDELHHSIKSDIGLSLRIMANNDIGRLDIVWSEEDTLAWLKYRHPF